MQCNTSIYKIKPEIYISSAIIVHVEVFKMAEKRKQLSDDIKKVIVEMRESGHKLHGEKIHHKPAVVVCLTRETERCLFDKFGVTLIPH